jgi:hypothetical protein
MLFGAVSQYSYFYNRPTTSDLKLDNKDLVQLTDTVYVNKTITKYDTIFVERIKNIPQIVYLERPQEFLEQTELSKLELEQKNNQEKPFNNDFSETLSKESELIKSPHPNNVENKSLKEYQKNNGPIVLQKIESKEFKDLYNNLEFPKIENLEPAKSKNTEYVKREPKRGVIERTSLGLMAGLSGNQLIIKNSTIQGMFKSGYDISANIDININKKWDFQTGITYDHGNYATNSSNKQVLNAIEIDGKPTFIYKTPLGNAVIPSNILNFTPKAGDFITIESEDQNELSFWKIPFSLSYNFFERDVLFLGSYKTIKLNAFGGGFLSIPVLNHSHVEIYEPDGEDFYTTLTDYKGVSNLAFGGRMGLGSKIFFRRRLAFTTEASVYRNATYLVNNEFYQSIPQGGRLKFGFSYNLK